MTLASRMGRFRTRCRKAFSDPVAFAADLEPAWLRVLCRGLVMTFMVLDDLHQLKFWAAAAEWRLRRVKIVRLAERPGAAYWTPRGETGAAPRRWPGRLAVVSHCEMVLCAFSEKGVFLSGVTAHDRWPSFINVMERPFLMRAYALDSGEDLLELDVRPVNATGVFLAERRRGVQIDIALERAWPGKNRRSSTVSRRQYEEWVKREETLPAATPRQGPLISVIMPVHDPNPAHLQAALTSVYDQSYGHWQLCIADDGSKSRAVRRLLEDAATRGNVTVRFLEGAGGVSVATNAALQTASGEIVAFLDHDDVLAPDALARLADVFEDPEVQAAYSDEDTIDAQGRRSAPVFKEAFNYERLLSQNYLNHLFAARRAVVEEVGGLRRAYDSAQDYDLLLRICETVRWSSIRHIPEILYHWRSYPGGRSLSQIDRARASGARRRAVEAHLRSRGLQASVSIDRTGYNRLNWRIPDPAPQVCAIVPTRDNPDLLRSCVRGLLEATDYPNLKVCIVDNGSVKPTTLALMQELEEDDRVEVLRRPGRFNHSALNNDAARRTNAEVLAILNDDILVLEPDWLKTMVAQALRPDVGAVGAKLFYPDGRIQHAGVVLGLGRDRVAGHEFRGAPADHLGEQSRLLVTREVSAVTAACLVVERSKYLAVGGFDEQTFPIAFNDVDLCLRLAGQGLRNIWTPYARLIHIESASRGATRAKKVTRAVEQEVRRMHARWAMSLMDDRHFHPALSREDELFSLAEAPPIATPR